MNIKHTAPASYGVSLKNSTNCNVIGNIANGQNSDDYWVNGIFVDLSTNNRVNCNQSNTLGTGLFFGGAQGPSTVIAKNVMNNNYRGLVLNFGVVGQQGSSGSPNDNRWIGITSNHYHTYSWFSTGANSPFYVRTAFGVYRPNPHYQYAFPAFAPNYIPLIPTSGNLNSMLCPAILLPGGGQLATTMAVQIAEDSITPVAYPASTTSMLRQSLYSFLETDSSLVNTHPVIAQFRNYHAQHSVGKLDKVEKIIGSSLLQAPAMLQIAKALNNSVVPISLADSNSQWMNNLLIDNALADAVDYTAAQLTDLRILAVKCPYEDGKAVIQARTILGQYDTVMYMNDCELAIPMEQRSMNLFEQTETEQGNAFRLYPNPNDGSMLLDYSLNIDETGEIKIMDITGKLVGSYRMDNAKQQLMIDNRVLVNGIYIYHIVVNDKVVKSDKLIIIK